MVEMTAATVDGRSVLGWALAWLLFSNRQEVVLLVFGKLRCRWEVNNKIELLEVICKTELK
jgi:hypothetical protein